MSSQTKNTIGHLVRACLVFGVSKEPVFLKWFIKTKVVSNVSVSKKNKRVKLVKLFSALTCLLVFVKKSPKFQSQVG